MNFCPFRERGASAPGVLFVQTGSSIFSALMKNQQLVCLEFHAVFTVRGGACISPLTAFRAVGRLRSLT